MQAYLYLSKVECDRLANTLRRDDTKDRGDGERGWGEGKGRDEGTAPRREIVTATRLGSREGLPLRLPPTN